MNSFKQSGNYVYHLLQHSTALPFIHRVLMRFMSDTHRTNHLLNICNWSVCITETDGVLCEV